MYPLAIQKDKVFRFLDRGNESSVLIDMPHPEIPLRSVGVGVLILPVPASSVPHNEHGIVTGVGTKGGHNLGKINRELGIY